MGYLTKQDILKAEDLPSEPVDVPEWGGKVMVRALSADERDRFEMALRGSSDDPEKARIRAVYAGMCMVDEDGKRLFTDKELPSVGKKNAAAVDRVVDKVRELSGMKPEAVDKAAEDFGEAPSDGSGSG